MSKRLKLEDVCEFFGGSQPDKKCFSSELIDGYIRLIQIRDYKTDSFLTYIPKKYAKRFCDEKDIMIGRYGPPVFQLLRGIKGAYNVALIKAKPKSNTYREYLYYFLSQKSIYKYIEKLSFRTGGQTGVDLDSLKLYPIYLPLFEEQKKIVAILELIDKKIESNNQIKVQLENLAKTIYDYYFVQFDFPNAYGKPYKTSGGEMEYNEKLKRDIPKGWSVKKFADLVSSINTGLNPRDNFKLGTGKNNYVTIRNIEMGSLNFTGCDKIDDEALSVIHKRSKISKGDILFTSIEPVGKCFYISQEPKGWDINESVFSIRNNRKEIISDALFYYTISSQEFLKRGMGQATGSVHKGIRHHALKGINVLIPPIPVQEKVNSILESCLTQISTNNAQNNELAALRDFLLPMLMNGQVTVKSDSAINVDIMPTSTRIDYQTFIGQVGLAARGDIDEETMQNIYKAHCEKVSENGQSKNRKRRI